MLHNVNELHGLTIGASDGDIGEVKDVYFDDKCWVIRYLVTDTGGWLSGRKVLISPFSVGKVTWTDQVMHVNLSQQQVRDSPNIDTDKPVSRQHEADHSNYYGYPGYWRGAGLWGLGAYPMPWVGASADASLAISEPRDDTVTKERQERVDRERESADSHLRSGKELIGYQIAATDGLVGRVENFVFDDESWAIRYVVVDTRQWWPGKHVLLSPALIERVSWSQQEVFVNVTRCAVERSPEYDLSHPLSREHETGLYAHQARSTSWP